MPERVSHRGEARPQVASTWQDDGLDPKLTSVIVPARNEQNHIGAALDSILGQTEKDIEVLVIDGDSDDDTVRIVEERASRDPRIKLLHNPGRAIPNALNVALRTARGIWFVRVDAHSTIPNDYVEKAVAQLRSGKWGGVGGRKDAVAESPQGKAIAVALGSPFGVGNSLYHYGKVAQTVDHIPFGAYPTKLLRELGGWNEDLFTNEDYELDYRIRLRGHELLFDPVLAIDWRCKESLGELFWQYRRYGRGKAVVGRLHPESLAARHLAAPALIASWAAALLVRKRKPFLSTAIVAPYAIALGVATKKASQSSNDIDPLKLAASFMTMHAAWGLGFLEQLLRDSAKIRR